jgi:hypothetical protein
MQLLTDVPVVSYPRFYAVSAVQMLVSVIQ